MGDSGESGECPARGDAGLLASALGGNSPPLPLASITVTVSDGLIAAADAELTTVVALTSIGDEGERACACDLLSSAGEEGVFGVTTLIAFARPDGLWNGL